ncbi:putative exonuclease [Vibrio phage 1.084.O._10N.261.49.F5]|nr:putative exonuclease [Vibrio phage 1.084.O._10N.261.49.F5]
MNNNTIYKFTEDSDFNVKTMFQAEQFASFKFNALTTADTDRRRMGFVVNTISGEYLDEVQVKGNTFHIVTIREQKKSPEKYLIDAQVADKKAQYLLETDKLPEKSLVKEWKDEATDVVLRITIPKQPKDYIVAVRDDGVIFVEAKGKMVEDLTALIRKTIGTFPVIPFETDTPVTDFMDNMVSDGVKDVFTLGNKATLVDEEGINHQLSKGSLYDSDAEDYVKNGMFVTSLALNYDGVVDFTLKDDFVLEGIKFDKDAFEEEDNSEAGTFLLQLDELNKVVNELISRVTPKQED